MKPLEEFDLNRLSVVLDWIGRCEPTVGVIYQNGHHYELEGVGDDVWRSLVDQFWRADEWARTGPHDVERKPREVSVHHFYKEYMEDFHPRWSVDHQSGLCTPKNELAHRWEAAHGERGQTRVHRYTKGGRYGRHEH